MYTLTKADVAEDHNLVADFLALEERAAELRVTVTASQASFKATYRDINGASATAAFTSLSDLSHWLDGWAAASRKPPRWVYVCAMCGNVEKAMARCARCGMMLERQPG